VGGIVKITYPWQPTRTKLSFTIRTLGSGLFVIRQALRNKKDASLVAHKDSTFFVPGNWLPSCEGPCSFASPDFSRFAFDGIRIVDILILVKGLSHTRVYYLITKASSKPGDAGGSLTANGYFFSSGFGSSALTDSSDFFCSAWSSLRTSSRAWRLASSSIAAFSSSPITLSFLLA
jgi:hypothetical protein